MNKLSTKLPALLILASGVIGLLMASAICTTGIPALDPVRYVEADATATAIAPALYPTVRYNEEVLPTQQAVEAQEIVMTTKHKYEWDRFVNQAIALAAISWRVSVTLSVASLAVGVMVAVGAYSWERAKRAQAYVPVQRMPDSAWYIPRERQLGDTRSGIGLLEVLPTAREHTEAVRQFRGVVFRSVAASFFDTFLRRKVRVNEWKPDSREIIVQ